MIIEQQVEAKERDANCFTAKMCFYLLRFKVALEPSETVAAIDLSFRKYSWVLRSVLNHKWMVRARGKKNLLKGL